MGRNHGFVYSRRKGVGRSGRQQNRAKGDVGVGGKDKETQEIAHIQAGERRRARVEEEQLWFF